jgi:hypothetical protein
MASVTALSTADMEILEAPPPTGIIWGDINTEGTTIATAVGVVAGVAFGWLFAIPTAISGLVLVTTMYSNKKAVYDAHFKIAERKQREEEKAAKLEADSLARQGVIGAEEKRQGFFQTKELAEEARRSAEEARKSAEEARRAKFLEETKDLKHQRVLKRHQEQRLSHFVYLGSSVVVASGFFLGKKMVDEYCGEFMKTSLLALSTISLLGSLFMGAYCGYNTYCSSQQLSKLEA